MNNEYGKDSGDVRDNRIPAEKSRLWSVLALIAAVLSILLCYFAPVPGIVLGALAIALCIVSRLRIGYFDGFSIAALICAIFGIVFSISFIILSAILV